MNPRSAQPSPRGGSTESFALAGQVVDLERRVIEPATIVVEQGRIARILPGEPANDAEPTGAYLLPGFVDAHVHVESSMLPPAEFARQAVVHGTVATVSDPHEIANVLGIEGVRYMARQAARSPLEICFGAPSCVPATRFESAGAVIEAEDLAPLFEDGTVRYLSEVMNYPGVLADDPGLLAKIALARRHGRPVDGHAPGLRGEDARRYAAHGITTDHECFTLEEALDKIAAGMKILIREGSAAKNFDALAPLLQSHPDRCMFCSDDSHADRLSTQHINTHVQRAVAEGYSLWNTLRAASWNPVQHYGLNTGLLREGDPADFLVVNSLKEFRVLRTYLRGRLVAQEGTSFLPALSAPAAPAFWARPITLDQLRAAAARLDGDLGGSAPASRVRVIDVRDGQLVTGSVILPVNRDTEGLPCSDLERDVLKLVVVNRYRDAAPAVAFVRNVGIKRGAMASSVAHDSHNVVAVGVDDASLIRAINAVVAQGGGLAVTASGDDEPSVLPLEIAGLMTTLEGGEAARRITQLDAKARQLGSSLSSPLMTLSFLALLVIPELKLSDLGLFDGAQFQFTDVLLP